MDILLLAGIHFDLLREALGKHCSLKVAWSPEPWPSVGSAMNCAVAFIDTCTCAK